MFIANAAKNKTEVEADALLKIKFLECSKGVAILLTLVKLCSRVDKKLLSLPRTQQLWP